MASIQNIEEGDFITDSRTDINTNFANLNSDKIETSVIDIDTTLSANSDSKIPSQKAVKAYVDAGGNPFSSTTQAGIVEEATQAEVDAGTAVGATGARLYVNPSTISSGITKRTYEFADSPVTWNKPTGLSHIVVQIWAGGGGGARATRGGGGAGGSYAEATIAADELGSTETITIGAGGAGIALEADGNSGGNSTFGNWVLANGGQGSLAAGGGTGGNSFGVSIGSFAGAAGGADGNPPTTGSQSIYGGGGGGGSSTAVSATGATGGNSVYGGGGGGGCGGTSAGAGGAGGTSKIGGDGGSGSVDTSANGSNGITPAGGAGGSRGGTGGTGGDGRAIVIEFYN